MAILSNVIDDFIDNLEKSAHFKNMKIIKAYPYVVKPTRLSKTVLCVSLAKSEEKAVAIGDDEMFSSYIIDVDVFVPFNLGAETINNVFKDIINACENITLSSISTSNIEADRNALCFKAKCSLSFNDILENGGM